MQIIQFPHSTLRHRSKALRKVDAGLRQIVAEMFDLMYEAKGIGLAANQVDLPIRLFCINQKSDPNEKEEELVFINPIISKRKGQAEAEEGCLSLVGLYGDVVRPEKIHINAFNLSGEEINQEVDGLLARVIQHETDHLDGVLFIDRLSPSGKLTAKAALEEFEIAFESRCRTGEIPDENTIVQRLSQFEQQYC